jgi:hypothetical protein
MEQIADRRLAVLAASKSGHIGFDRIIDGFDRAFRDGNPNQYAHDRLDHGL